MHAEADVPVVKSPTVSFEPAVTDGEPVPQDDIFGKPFPAFSVTCPCASTSTMVVVAPAVVELAISRNGSTGLVVVEMENIAAGVDEPTLACPFKNTPKAKAVWPTVIEVVAVNCEVEALP